METRFTKEKEEQLVKLLETPYVYYADYRDRIDTPFLRELLDNIETCPDIDPMFLFRDKLQQAYEGAEYPSPKEYAPEIGVDYDALTDNDKERFDEVFIENIRCEPDFDHFLSQEVCVDIIIDSGDFNWDLGCNQVYPHYDGDYDDLKRHGVPKDSCVAWLAKKQGYTRTQLKNALADRVYNNSRFLKSLREELLNCTSHMNCLVFLKKMTIREWLESMDKKTIAIPKDTACGLVDFWCGAGGLLEIELEKDISVPQKNISQIIPDECRRYNIHEIYGGTDVLWEPR